MKDLAFGKIGTELEYSVKLDEGKVFVVADYKGAQTQGKIDLVVDADALLGFVAKKIPGSIDDLVIGFVQKFKGM
jgi:hypothetical protein